MRPSVAGKAYHALARRGWGDGKRLLGGFVVLGGHALAFEPSCPCDLVVDAAGLCLTGVGHARPLSIPARSLVEVAVSADPEVVTGGSRWLAGGIGSRQAAPTRFLIQDLPSRHPGGTFVRITAPAAEALLYSGSWSPEQLNAAFAPVLSPGRRSATVTPGLRRGWGLLRRRRAASAPDRRAGPPAAASV